MITQRVDNRTFGLILRVKHGKVRYVRVTWRRDSAKHSTTLNSGRTLESIFLNEIGTYANVQSVKGKASTPMKYITSYGSHQRTLITR